MSDKIMMTINMAFVLAFMYTGWTLALLVPMIFGLLGILGFYVLYKKNYSILRNNEIVDILNVMTNKQFYLTLLVSFVSVVVYGAVLVYSVHHSLFLAAIMIFIMLVPTVITTVMVLSNHLYRSRLVQEK